MMLDKLKEKRISDPFAWFVFGSVMILVVLLFFFEIPQSNRDIIFMAMGAYVGFAGAVVSFKYGSSKDSADKDKLLHEKPAPGGMSLNITPADKEEK